MDAISCESSYQKILTNPISDLEKKILEFRQLEKACEKHGRYYFLLAKLYEANQQYSIAQSVVQKGLTTTNNYRAELLYIQAGIYFLQKEYITAEKLATELVHNEPNFFGGHAILSDIYLLQKKFDRVVVHANQANKMQELSSLYSALVIAYYELGMFDKSLHAYQKGITLKDNDSLVKSDAIITAAYSAVELKRYDLANEIINVRIKKFPDSQRHPGVQRLIAFLKTHNK